MRRRRRRRGCFGGSGVVVRVRPVGENRFFPTLFPRAGVGESSNIHTLVVRLDQPIRHILWVNLIITGDSSTMVSWLLVFSWRSRGRGEDATLCGVGGEGEEGEENGPVELWRV